MDKIRELWINKRLNGTLDNMKNEKVMQLAGYYYPDGDKWEVIGLWEGEGITCSTQFKAEVLSNQITMIGLMLQEQGNKVDTL